MNKSKSDENWSEKNMGSNESVQRGIYKKPYLLDLTRYIYLRRTQSPSAPTPRLARANDVLFFVCLMWLQQRNTGVSKSGPDVTFSRQISCHITNWRRVRENSTWAENSESRPTGCGPSQEPLCLLLYYTTHHFPSQHFHLLFTEHILCKYTGGPA